MAMANGGGGGSRVREREQGERRRARESESGAGQLRGFVRGIEGVRGSRRWPAGGRWRARVPASVGHTPVLLAEEEGDRGGGPGGLGRLLAGPACCCWAAQGRGGPGKPLLLFCFSI